MAASDLVLKFYVSDVQQDDDGIYFMVVHTNTPALSYTVMRSKGEWSCTCNQQPTCDHIGRAMLFYNNMLARAKDLKEQLKIRKEMREQPTAKKRLIRLQGK